MSCEIVVLTLLPTLLFRIGEKGRVSNRTGRGSKVTLSLLNTT